MKILTTALMVSAMALAGAAQAEVIQPDSPEFNTQASAQNQETRAQVVAELHAAQAAGLVRTGEDVTYPHVRAWQRFEAQQHAALGTAQQSPASVSSTSHS